MSQSIVIEMAGLTDLAPLDGKTFQVHVFSPMKLVLYPVTLAPPPTRCPVVVGGEQCAGVWGHKGKHAWGRGD